MTTAPLVSRRANTVSRPPHDSTLLDKIMNFWKITNPLKIANALPVVSASPYQLSDAAKQAATVEMANAVPAEQKRRELAINECQQSPPPVLS